MKKTLYISDEAWKVLKTKKNMSRYVSDLIIADSENKTINEERIVNMVLSRISKDNIAIPNENYDGINMSSIEEILKL